MAKNRKAQIEVRCGYGTITIEGNSYRAQVMDDGKRLSRSFKNLEDAQDFLESLYKRSRRYGIALDRAKITWGELAEMFLEAKRTANLKKTTIQGYQIILRHCAVWDKIPAQQVTALHIDRLMQSLSRRSGNPFGPKSQTNALGVIHAVLQYGMRKDIVQRNVAELAERPKNRSSGKQKIKVWSVESLNKFLGSLDEPRDRAIFWVLGSTGMRKGEMLGLKWSDIDLETGRVHIQRRVVRLVGEIDIDTPKSEAGDRYIVLVSAARRVLKAWRAQQDIERNAFEKHWHEDDWIFSSRSHRWAGRFLEPRWINKRMDQLIEKAGFPRVTVHELRHTFITAMLQSGVPVEEVSRSVGHSTIWITRHYGHAVPRSVDPVTAKGEELFGAADASTPPRTE